MAWSQSIGCSCSKYKPNQTDIRALVGQQPDVASPDARSVESELDLAVSADVRSSPPALRLVVVTMGLRTAPTG